MSNKIKESILEKIQNISEIKNKNKQNKLLELLFIYVNKNKKKIQKDKELLSDIKKLLLNFNLDLQKTIYYYEQIFKTNFPYEKSINKYINLIKPSLELKSKIQQRLKFTMFLEGNIIGTINLNLTISVAPKWYTLLNKNKKIVNHLYIGFVNVKSEYQNKGYCKKQFHEMIKSVNKNVKIDIISLLVSSDMSERACNCYIRGALLSKYYPITKAMNNKCNKKMDNYNIIFTKYKNTKKIDKMLKEVNSLGFSVNYDNRL